jgi:hypothetical protein
METSFYNKDGALTEYGLSCGYVEKVEINGQYAELYKEHNAYHVRYGTIGTRFTEWLTYDNLTPARKSYNNKLSQLKKAAKVTS